MSSPVFTLPPDVRIEPGATPLAEVVDPFHEFLGVADLQKRNAGEVLDFSIPGGSRPIVYAVLDTGVDTDHPDLKTQLLDAADFTGSMWGEEDRNGHGSWCCGAIAAAPDTFGIRGIAYKGRLLSGKVLGDSGSGSETMIARGLDWAFKKGADVFSLSLGGPRMSDRLHAMFREVSQQKGKFIFAASGNDGGVPNVPGAWPECVCVGAVDRQGKLTEFTSRGPELDILAPGVEILSTLPGGRHGTMTGTSMATPIAAAVGGLIWAEAVNAGRGEILDGTAEMVALLRKTGRCDGDVGGPGDVCKYPLIDPRELAKVFVPPVVPPVPPAPVPTPGMGPSFGDVMIFADGQMWKSIGWAKA